MLTCPTTPKDMDKDLELPLDDYRRYGRQMVLDGFGLSGQLKLQRSSIAVVGAGGLGCPALQYLAAAGVAYDLGRIGIIDHDTVDVSNLQRQILHNDLTVGMHKTESAALAIRHLNSKLKVDAISEQLSPSNAIRLLQGYDVILDCTDNQPTRYLLSDTAVYLGKPLVSGAAEKYHGHVCVYNLGEHGMCYRCLFPTPPPPGPTCEQSGILGAVTGIIGNIQALEAIKIITGLHNNESTFLVFSALSTSPFDTLKFGRKNPTCPACGKDSQKIGEIQDIDYVKLCGGRAPDWEQQGLADGNPNQRIRAKEFKLVLEEDHNKLNVIDVRPPLEFGICKLPGSINVPLEELVANPASYLPLNDKTETYVLCRLGNDSQIATKALREYVQRSRSGNIVIKDVVGGLRAWTKEVDASFPLY